MPRGRLLEKIKTAFVGQGLAVILRQDEQNPAAGRLFMELDSRAGGESFPLEMFFLNAETEWAALRFDAFCARGVALDKLSNSAMERLSLTLCYLQTQTVGPFFFVDELERRLVCQFNIILAKPAEEDFFLRQLDVMLMLTIICAGMWIPVLYSVAYEEMEPLDAVEKISDAARLAGELVAP